MSLIQTRALREWRCRSERNIGPVPWQSDTQWKQERYGRRPMTFEISYSNRRVARLAIHAMSGHVRTLPRDVFLTPGAREVVSNDYGRNWWAFSATGGGELAAP